MAFGFTKANSITGAQARYLFKERLKTAGWTTLSSSDGTTYNAAGDQITSGSSGAGGFANANAWWHGTDPVGAIELVLQRTNVNQNWRDKLSISAGFVGGSPSATQVPSASDEVVLVGSGTDAAPTGAGIFGGSDGTYQFNCAADNAAPYGFWAGAFPSGGGDPNHAFVLDPLTQTAAGDAFTYAIHCGSSTVFTSSTMSQETYTQPNRFISYRASVTPTTLIDLTALLYNSSGGVVIPDGGSTNPITANDEVFPMVLARRGAIANAGYKGICTLMKWVSVNRATGDTLSVSTTRDRIIYGQVALPWDGTVPTV